MMSLCRYYILKRGQGYEILDTAFQINIGGRFSTFRAANAYCDRVIDAEAEGKDRAPLMDGWAL